MKKDKNRKIPAAMAIGAGGGWMVTLLGAMLLALLIQQQVMDAQIGNYGAMLVLFLASVTAAAIAAKSTPENRLLMCLGGSGFFFVSLACAGIVIFGGVKVGVLPTLVLTLSGGIVVLLLGKKAKGHKKYRIGKGYR